MFWQKQINEQEVENREEKVYTQWRNSTPTLTILKRKCRCCCCDCCCKSRSEIDFSQARDEKEKKRTRISSQISFTKASAYAIRYHTSHDIFNVRNTLSKTRILDLSLRSYVWWSDLYQTEFELDWTHVFLYWGVEVQKISEKTKAHFGLRRKHYIDGFHIVSKRNNE